MKTQDVAFQDLGQIESEKLEQSRHGQHTLIVWRQTPALLCAQLAQQKDARLILCVDRDNEITGIITPAQATERISLLRGQTFGNLLSAFEAMASDPQEVRRNFIHEVLNEWRFKKHYCYGCSSIVDRCPCGRDGHNNCT